jgi:hypothetical protein
VEPGGPEVGQFKTAGSLEYSLYPLEYCGKPALSQSGDVQGFRITSDFDNESCTAYTQIERPSNHPLSSRQIGVFTNLTIRMIVSSRRRPHLLQGGISMDERSHRMLHSRQGRLLYNVIR